MKPLRSLFIFTFVLCATFLNAQTVDDIINKHIDAMGGKDVIAKIKSQVIYSDISVMGASLSTTTTILAGKGFKNVSSFNGQDIIQAVTTTGGWMVNPLAGAATPQPLPADEVKEFQSSLDIGGELFDYKAKSSKVELVGKESIEGINAYKLKLVNKDGKETFYFIDPATHRLIRQESIVKVNGEDVKTYMIFSNYIKTDIGLVVPYTTISNQGFELTISITKIEFNKEIDPKIFEMPKG